MKEHPILFSSPMVRAILSGAKTQTRRIVNPQPTMGEYGWTWPSSKCRSMVSIEEMPSLGPHGGRGDRMWVKETWQTGSSMDAMSPSAIGAKCVEAGYSKPWAPIRYQADGRTENEDTLRDFGRGWGKLRPSIFMPRWASRITLEISEVRVQRLQEISEDDARAEGCSGRDPEPVAEGGTIYAWHGRSSAPCPRAHFMTLWDSINGKVRPMLDDDGNPVLDDNEKPITVAPRSWASNPWVWAYTFRRIS